MLEGDKCFGQKAKKKQMKCPRLVGKLQRYIGFSAEETAGTNAQGLEQAWNVEGAAGASGVE